MLDPLFDSSGKLLGVVHLLYDITDRKRAEQRLQQFNYELQQRELALSLELRESKARRERIATAVPGVICEYRVAPDGASHFAGVADDLPIAEHERTLCIAQGKRLAEIAVKLGK